MREGTSVAPGARLSARLNHVVVWAPGLPVLLVDGAVSPVCQVLQLFVCVLGFPAALKVM